MSGNFRGIPHHGGVPAWTEAARVVSLCLLLCQQALEDSQV